MTQSRHHYFLSILFPHMAGRLSQHRVQRLLTRIIRQRLKADIALRRSMTAEIKQRCTGTPET